MKYLFADDIFFRFLVFSLKLVLLIVTTTTIKKIIAKGKMFNKKLVSIRTMTFNFKELSKLHMRVLPTDSVDNLLDSSIEKEIQSTS